MKLRDPKGAIRITPRRLCGKILRHHAQFYWFLKLTLNNMLSKHRITNPMTDLVVSLTTHGRRLRHVHLAIESIGTGDLLPRAIVLWLDRNEFEQELTPGLKRLVQRGLTIKVSSGQYGPHTKYFPHCKSGFERPNYLVTADDDICYPKWWLRRLSDARPSKNSRSVVCYRAHSLVFEGDKIAPYNTWQATSSTLPSSLNFATGVSGVLYTPEFQELLAKSGAEFQKLCPTADDIWLHKIAISHNYKIKQVTHKSKNFMTILGTQSTRLQTGNVLNNRNDVQIEATYTLSDLDLLRFEAGI